MELVGSGGRDEYCPYLGTVLLSCYHAQTGRSAQWNYQVFILARIVPEQLLISFGEQLCR
jgi:hypothetical protein